MREILNVAHVGAYRRFSKDDQMRKICAIGQMALIEGNRWLNRARHIVINLCYGEDFLNPKPYQLQKFDAVVVHSIFYSRLVHGHPNYRRERRDRVGFKATSSEHTPENWNARLVQTGAKFIFVFETYPFSLSGWHIWDLEGYKTVYRGSDYTLYIKQEKKAKKKPKKHLEKLGA